MNDVVDPFAGDKEPIVAEAVKRGWTREQAIAHGAALGADTADQRGEIGAQKKERIERAKAYAAWDYDGRPSRHGDPGLVTPIDTDVPEAIVGALMPGLEVRRAAPPPSSDFKPSFPQRKK